MKDDSISRQAAIDALDTIHYTDREDWWAVLSTVEALPPVQPKRGRWMIEPTEDPEWCKCSECGYANLVVEVFSLDGYNFCPNCGADMRGDKDGRP